SPSFTASASAWRTTAKADRNMAPKSHSETKANHAGLERSASQPAPKRRKSAVVAKFTTSTHSPLREERNFGKSVALVQEVRDRIRVIAQKRQLLLPREVDPAVLVDEVPHEQHPQSHVERIVEIAPRHVDARRGTIETLDEPLDFRLQFERRE